MRIILRQGFTFGLMALSVGALYPSPAWSQQTPRTGAVGSVPHGPERRPPNITLGEPDAERTRNELSRLLDHYPPALRNVLALDPTLLQNEAYLATYPGLAAYLNSHPEVVHNAGFYIGAINNFDRRFNRTRDEIVNNVLSALAVFAGFGMGIGLLTWLIRTLIDYRRWSRLAKVQTDAHTRLLERFTSNEDLLDYIKSPSGSRFLQSSPILLDAGQRSVGAPLGRILWSVQAGIALVALGIGLQLVSGRATEEAAQALHGMGVIGIALGFGFILSAIISYIISHRLGLIEASVPRPEPPLTQG